MLSNKKLKEYQQQLNLEKDYCMLIKIGTKSLNSKLKQKPFFDNNNIETLYGQINPIKIYDNLIDTVSIATFLIFISKFENIFYKIFETELNKFKTYYSDQKESHEFLDLFINIKNKKDFVPFREITPVISKISSIDLNYIKEIIALRNYFAHGKKESEQLKLKGNNNADVKLINDLETINKKLQEILEKLER